MRFLDDRNKLHMLISKNNISMRAGDVAETFGGVLMVKIIH
jgi:hypothetical protein